MEPAESVMKEEIIEAISEWPVTDSGQDLYTSSTDKIHNPTSVSSFFLRNVGKAKKVLNDSFLFFNILSSELL